MQRKVRLWIAVVSVCLITRPATPANAQASGTLWESPVVLFDAGQSGKVFNPLVVEDTEGRIKILWETTVAAESGALANGIYCVDGDGTQWSPALDVIRAQHGGRTYWPRYAIDTYGRIHLVWVGPNATLYYSRAPSAEACNAQSWKTVAIPIRYQVLYSDIVVDAQDTIHIVFAVRGSDVYYIRSTDDGFSWTNHVPVSSVQPTAATSFPSLAVDRSGRIYVAWEENRLPDGVPSLGLYYAVSQDREQIWSAPVRFSQGSGQYTQPTVVALEDGTVHFLWNGRISTRGRYHQWSADGGITWSTISEFVPKTMGGGQTGPPGFAIDSAGMLNIVVGTDDTTYALWTGHSWMPAYDIASFGTYGNMEDQNICVAQGHVLYAVANAALRQIILIRGVADVPEVVPEFRIPPTLPPEQILATVTADPVRQSVPFSRSVAYPLSSESSNPPSDSFDPIIISTGLAALIVVAIVIASWRHRRI